MAPRSGAGSSSACECGFRGRFPGHIHCSKTGLECRFAAVPLKKETQLTKQRVERELFKAGRVYAKGGVRLELDSEKGCMVKKTDDQRLVDRVKEGDKKAFDVLVIKYQHKIVKLVMRYIRDPAEAQDVSQEAFIKAYRALPKFRGDSAFYTWLYRIAINTAKNHIVSMNRKPLDYDLDPQNLDGYEVHPKLRNDDAPDKILQREELRQTLEDAIDALPEELRVAIVLREIDGLSYEEIAEAMECPVGTVRSRIFRARDAVDKKIRPLLGSSTRA